jgi:hypothetical protein
MALGTGHIHLLDTELFSDYSPPIGLGGFGRAGAAEELIREADSKRRRFPDEVRLSPPTGSQDSQVSETKTFQCV